MDGGLEPRDQHRERYADLIRLYLRPTFGATPAGKIDAELLEMFYGRLRRCRELCVGRPRTGHTCRPLAANSIRKIHFIVRATLDLGVRWRHLGVNEAEIARPPAFERHDLDPPSAEEAAALLNDAADDPEWCLFLWLTMVTGSRRGEMCAIRWTDLDLTRKIVSLSRAISGTTEKSTKSHQGRRLALDDQAVTMLAAHLARRRQVCEALGVDLPTDGFVFSASPDGARPLRPATATVPQPRPAERQPRGPYEVLANKLRSRIRSGDLASGTQLPAIVDPAEAHCVSVGTAQRAIQMLKAEHLISTSPGRRSVVG